LRLSQRLMFWSAPPVTRRNSDCGEKATALISPLCASGTAWDGLVVSGFLVSHL
jgi:hypothetical protein